MAKDGFETMASELQQLASVVTDEKVRKKAIMAGIEPIVPIAQRIMRPFRRNSRGGTTLDQSIKCGYHPKGSMLVGKRLQESVGTIGWDGDAYYGRFYEHGYRPITGKRAVMDGRLRWIHSSRRPSGHPVIQRQHISRAYQADEENVLKRIIGVLQREIKNKI